MKRLTQDLSCEAPDIHMEFPRCTPGLIEHRRVEKQRNTSDKWRIFLSNFSALAPFRQLDGPGRTFRIQIKVVPELAPVLRVPSPNAPKGRHQLEKKSIHRCFFLPP